MGRLQNGDLRGESHEPSTLTLSSDALVIEGAELGLIFDLKLLLSPSGGVGNVDLHRKKTEEGARSERPKRSVFQVV